MTWLAFFGEGSEVNMSLIIVSDEAGCLGPSYVRGSSKNYLISTICFPKEAALRAFVDLAKMNAPKFLGSPLRKWTGLNRQTKENPEALSAYLEEVFAKMNEGGNAFALSMFLLNKRELQSGENLKKKDKRIIKQAADNGYTLCFKRFFPFVKRYHFVANGYLYGDPNVKWYIDINDTKFQERQRDSISRLAEINKVNLDGPHFVKKKDENNYYVACSIKAVDIIAGVGSRAFDSYVSHVENCRSKDCLVDKDCQNEYIECWKNIVKYASKRNVVHSGNKIWLWEGLLYSPSINRGKHTGFLTPDNFFI